MPMFSPQGPTKPQFGHLYSTPWLRTRGLRPIGWKHPGQGKVVEPSSAKGMPDDVQVLARSLMWMPRSDSAHDLPLFMVA